MNLPVILLIASAVALPGEDAKPAGVVVQSDFSQLKVRKQPPPPKYPEKAKAERIEGVVLVQVIIDPEGIPTLAQALEGPKALRSAAEQYAMEFRFEPALLKGKPVYARFKLPVAFRLGSK